MAPLSGKFLRGQPWASPRRPLRQPQTVSPVAPLAPRLVFLVCTEKTLTGQLGLALPRISENLRGHENGMRMADDFWDSLTKLLEFFKVRPIEVRNSVTTNQLRHGQTPWHPWLSPANCSSSSPILPWNSVWLQNGCNLSLSYYVILIMIIIIQYDNHPIIPHLSGCSFSSMVYSCSDATRKQSKTVQNGPKRSLIKSALSPLLPAMAAASPQKLWSTGSKIWWLHGVFYQRWTYHRKLWTLF